MGKLETSMLEPLHIELKASRYAMAFLALQRAQHSWHQMDAALVYVQQAGADSLSVATAQEALSVLDRHLNRLSTLLS
jgi:hypothetical protein